MLRASQWNDYTVTTLTMNTIWKADCETLKTFFKRGHLTSMGSRQKLAHLMAAYLPTGIVSLDSHISFATVVKTTQKCKVPAPEALADMRPELGHLIQDGGV